MDPMAFLATLWPCLSGGLIMPLTSWLKSKLPTDLPIGTALIALLLSTIVIVGIVYIFQLPMDLKSIVLFVLGTDKIASLIHDGKKTFKKNTL